MKDLHDIGLRGRLPNFISNFLSDRSFNVRIGSTLSETFEQEQGVPQGSILSPTLFNIKINNIDYGLDTIHHQGLRLALGAFRTSPVESLYAESNEPTLYIRRVKLPLQYTTKLAANPKNPAHKCVFNPKYERFYKNTPSTIKPLGLRIQPLLEQANISIKNVQPFSLPSIEPWTQNPPKVILDLHKNKKSEADSHIFKTEFLEIKSAYKHYISIYTDGSKQDEKVACAVISPKFTDSIRLPDNSSIFTAEAKAIDIALYHIRDPPEKQIFQIHSLF